MIERAATDGSTLLQPAASSNTAGSMPTIPPANGTGPTSEFVNIDPIVIRSGRADQAPKKKGP